MAGSRSLIALLVALLALVVLATIAQAEDTGSAITTPVAQSPVGDYEGADGGDSIPDDDDAAAPDAGSLGAPVSSTPGSDSTNDNTTTTIGSSASGASSAIGMANIAFSAAAALVGYIML